MIEGVTVKNLLPHCDDRGMLFEVLSVSHDNWDPNEPMVHAYIATCDYHVAKATHCHVKQVDRFCMVGGRAKVMLLDLRGPFLDLPFGANLWRYGNENFLDWLGAKSGGNPEGLPTPDAWHRLVQATGFKPWPSPTFLQQQTVIMSKERPSLLRIPQFVAHGQMALSEESVLLNLPTLPHDPLNADELRMEPGVGGLKWEVVSR